MTKTNVPIDDSTRDTANRAPGPRTRPRPGACGVGATSGALISAMVLSLPVVGRPGSAASEQQEGETTQDRDSRHDSADQRR